MDDFEKIKAADLSEAMKLILDEGIVSPFRDSTHYDVLLDDGTRLAPKALLGIAARRALDMDVRPNHFRGGENTPCFRVLRSAGFRIVTKADPQSASPAADKLKGDN